MHRLRKIGALTQITQASRFGALIAGCTRLVRRTHHETYPTAALLMLSLAYSTPVEMPLVLPWEGRARRIHAATC
jgi:TRAP-type C4-dicarboxylate transport system permease small subunit